MTSHSVMTAASHDELIHVRQAGLALLVGWPGEMALQRAVTGGLFRTMVQRRDAAVRLASIDSWRQLAGVSRRRHHQ